MTNYEQVRNVNKPAAATQKQQQPSRRTDPGLTRQQHPAAILQRATAAPESLTTADVLQLQRTIGNRAVGQLLSGIGAAQREPADHGSLIQAKLTINPPGDVYEQEADRVAGQVVDRINQPASQPAGLGQAVQRQPPPEEEELLQGKMIQRQPEEEEELLQGKMIDTIQRQDIPEEEEELQMMPVVQRKPGGGIAAAPDLEAAIQRARGSGQPLSRGIRAPMEQAFGADFGGVKVHTGAESDLLNRSIQARAFTTGQDIFFSQGAYDPGSRSGQELLAHEMTHVVQQHTGAYHLQRWPWNRKGSEHVGLLDSEKEEENAWRIERRNALRGVLLKYANVIRKATRGAWKTAKGKKAVQVLGWIKQVLKLAKIFDPTQISDVLKKVVGLLQLIMQGIAAWKEFMTGETLPLLDTVYLEDEIGYIESKYDDLELPSFRLPGEV